MRIVSLLPSVTEILHAIGAGPDVVGVTFECDAPAHAREDARIVSTTAIPEGLAPAEIDAFVTAAMQRGEDLYHLDAGALGDLDADLVITQDLCAVCAVDVSVVDDALTHLGCTAEVLTIDPHTLGEVIDSITTIGERTGHQQQAASLVDSLRQRLEALRPGPARRLMFLEWTEPPFAPGHWIPEMIELAGAVPVMGEKGAKSVRVTWEAVHAAAPDLIVVGPCGYDLPGSVDLGRQVLASLPAEVEVWAVDANASFARPGPRLVDGVEALAGILRGEGHEIAQRLR